MKKSPAKSLLSTSYGLRILGALQGSRIYDGSVPHEEKARRRAANKRARAARRKNR